MRKAAILFLVALFAGLLFLLMTKTIASAISGTTDPEVIESLIEDIVSDFRSATLTIGAFAIGFFAILFQLGLKDRHGFSLSQEDHLQMYRLEKRLALLNKNIKVQEPGSQRQFRMPWLVTPPPWYFSGSSLPIWLFIPYPLYLFDILLIIIPKKDYYFHISVVAISISVYIIYIIKILRIKYDSKWLKSKAGDICRRAFLLAERNLENPRYSFSTQSNDSAFLFPFECLYIVSDVMKTLSGNVGTESKDILNINRYTIAGDKYILSAVKKNEDVLYSKERDYKKICSKLKFVLVILYRPYIAIKDWWYTRHWKDKDQERWTGGIRALAVNPLDAVGNSVDRMIMYVLYLKSMIAAACMAGIDASGQMPVKELFDFLEQETMEIPSVLCCWKGKKYKKVFCIKEFSINTEKKLENKQADTASSEIAQTHSIGNHSDIYGFGIFLACIAACGEIREELRKIESEKKNTPIAERRKQRCKEIESELYNLLKEGGRYSKFVKLLPVIYKTFISNEPLTNLEIEDRNSQPSGKAMLYFAEVFFKLDTHKEVSHYE